MKPDCSIIIRAYNEEKHIGRLLSGIQQQTLKNVQIILVDSGSSDDTIKIANQFPVEVVKIKPQDFTFGRSLNLGISHARSDLVVMASAHVYPVYPDWLENLLKPFENPNVALSYGKQRGAQSTQFSEHQIFQHWFPEQSIANQAHPFCNNANSAVRRSLWEQHPYDESLTGLEDLGWANWAREQGLSISYVASAEVVHVHNESLDGIFNRYKREGMAFKQIYPQATFTFWDFLRLWVGNSFNDLRMAAKQKKALRNLRNIIVFRWLQFWGTYHGYRESGSLTWKLKKAFYYPRFLEKETNGEENPKLEPICYSEINSLMEKKD